MKNFIIYSLGLIILILHSGCSSIKPEDYAKVQSSYSNQVAVNQSMQSELAQQKEQASSLQKQMETLQGQLVEYSNENAGLKSIIESNKSEGVSQNSAQEISNLDIQIKSLQDRINAIETEQSNQILAKNQDIANMNAAQSNLVASLQKEIDSGTAQITQLSNMLHIDFLSEVFFDNLSVNLKPEGRKTLDKLAQVLKQNADKQIRVEGYADSTPIAPRHRTLYKSNWELSTARATAIIRYLQGKGIDPSQLKAAGYGEYNPVAPNFTKEGRAQNRRIVILLVQISDFTRYK